MATRMQQRRGTAAQWTSSNPTLEAGEIGFETDTNKFKIGDGTNLWANLDYFIDANSTVNPAFGSSITFEGATANDFETVLQVTDPTADRTITIPDVTGTVITTGNLSDITNIGVFTSTITMEGSTADDFELTLSAGDPTADRTITFPDATGTVALTADITATASNTATLTNKTINLTNNTVSGTLAEFNTAVSDADLASIAGTETLTNKTLTSPVISSITNTGTLTLPTTTGTLALTTDIPSGVVTTSDTGTVTSAMILDGTIANGDISASAAIDKTKISGTAITAGDTGTVTSTMILDGTIVNGDINASAAIDQSKISGLTTDLGSKLSLSGGTMTGAITLHADPSSALHATTKQYVDNTASGIIAKPQVLGATTANIDATYNNGTAGVGATLTHNTNGAFPAEAGGASGWAVGKGILVKNQTNKAQNGRYFVSDMGSESTPYILTRCTYCDEASEIPGAYIFVQDGTFAGTGWIQVVADPATFVVGTDNIDVFQFSGSGTITAGNGISVSGNEVSINTSVTADLSTAQTLTNKTLTSPTLTTPALGTPASGTLTNTTGLPLTTGVTGTLPISNGGTGATTAMTAATALLPTQTSNSGKYLTTDGAGTLSWGTVSGYSAPTLGSTSISSGATVANIDGLTINSTTIPSSVTLVSTAAAQTLTTKTIALGSNTISGTLAEFNTALTDADFATVAGTETLTNKTLTDPKIVVSRNTQIAGYTAVLTDSGKVVTINNASANNFTIPTNASVAFPIGTQILVAQLGAGQTTITGAGVTFRFTPGQKLRTTFSSATCIKIDTDEWLLVGDLAA